MYTSYGPIDFALVTRETPLSLLGAYQTIYSLVGVVICIFLGMCSYNYRYVSLMKYAGTGILS